MKLLSWRNSNNLLTNELSLTINGSMAVVVKLHFQRLLWDLRIASLKNMSALFAAYDRPCYQKLPSHLADLECYPKEILDCFKVGGFTVKVKGGIGHAIALDEAHEQCVNSGLKMAIVRPTNLKKNKILISHQSTDTISITVVSSL